MWPDQLYCSSRETFGMSINLDFLEKATRNNCLADDPKNLDFDKITQEQAKLLSTADRVGIAIPYLLWALIGTSANLMVIILIAKKKSMWTVPKFLLLNLAVADIIMDAFVIPLLASWHVFFYPIWRYSGWTCTLLNCLTKLSATASGASLTCISIYRFLVIYYPKKFIITFKHLIVTLVVIWTLSTGAIVSSVGKGSVLSIVSGGRYFRLCLQVHKNRQEERVELAFRLFFYSFTSLALLTLYTCLIRRLQNQEVPGQQSLRAEKIRDRRRRQAVHMMAAATVANVITYFPYMILVGINLSASEGYISAVPGIEIFTNVILMINSVINPFIYCAFSSHFRQEFWETYFKCTFGKGCREKENNSSNPVKFGRVKPRTLSTEPVVSA